nr:hypothetical protein CFP56_12969 [Quercus suber]
MVAEGLAIRSCHALDPGPRCSSAVVQASLVTIEAETGWETRCSITRDRVQTGQTCRRNDTRRVWANARGRHLLWADDRTTDRRSGVRCGISILAELRKRHEGRTTLRTGAAQSVGNLLAANVDVVIIRAWPSRRMGDVGNLIAALTLERWKWRWRSGLFSSSPEPTLPGPAGLPPTRC